MAETIYPIFWECSQSGPPDGRTTFPASVRSEAISSGSSQPYKLSDPRKRVFLVSLPSHTRYAYLNRACLPGFKVEECFSTPATPFCRPNNPPHPVPHCENCYCFKYVVECVLGFSVSRSRVDSMNIVARGKPSRVHLDAGTKGVHRAATCRSPQILYHGRCCSSMIYGHLIIAISSHGGPSPSCLLHIMQNPSSIPGHVPRDTGTFLQQIA